MIKYLPEFARKKRTPANGATRLSANGLIADEYRTHLLFQLLNLMAVVEEQHGLLPLLAFSVGNPRIFAMHNSVRPWVGARALRACADGVDHVGLDIIEAQSE